MKKTTTRGRGRGARSGTRGGGARAGARGGKSPLSLKKANDNNEGKHRSAGSKPAKNKKGGNIEDGDAIKKMKRMERKLTKKSHSKDERKEYHQQKMEKKQKKLEEKIETEMALERAVFGEKASTLMQKYAGKELSLSDFVKKKLIPKAEKANVSRNGVKKGSKAESGSESEAEEEKEELLFFIDKGKSSDEKVALDENEGEMNVAVEKGNSSDIEVKKARKSRNRAQKNFQENTELFEDDLIMDNVKRRPAWIDDEAGGTIDITADKKLRKLRNSYTETVIKTSTYEKKLRNQFVRLNDQQTWAIPRARDLDTALDALRQTKKIVNSHANEALPRDILHVMRMRDLNQIDYSQSVVQVVKFHSNAQLAFTAGLDKTIRLFNVDGKNNSKIQSVYLPDLPIFSASFSADETEIIASGRRKFLYTFNLEHGQAEKIPYIAGRDEKFLTKFDVSPCGRFIAVAGNNGAIIILSAKTKQWVANLHMNAHVNSIKFSSTGDLLYSYGGDGQVYIWEMSSRRCVHRFADEGCLKGTAITISKDGRYIACGSDSGIVNLYDANTTSSEPTPLKTFDNITTPITGLKFNNDTALLAMYSRESLDCFKLAHVSSQTVFQNWPTSSTPLHYVNAIDFRDRKSVV